VAARGHAFRQAVPSVVAEVELLAAVLPPPGQVPIPAVDRIQPGDILRVKLVAAAAEALQPAPLAELHGGVGQLLYTRAVLVKKP
jgi:hypothetical protein